MERCIEDGSVDQNSGIFSEHHTCGLAGKDFIPLSSGPAADIVHAYFLFLDIEHLRVFWIWGLLYSNL